MATNRSSITLAILAIVQGLLLASAGKPPYKVTYYVHANFLPPQLDALQVASANGTFTNAGLYGDIQVFDSLIRKGVASDSTIIGRAIGQLTFLKGGYQYVTFVDSLSLPTYKGSIIGASTHEADAASWESGINSGTGDFRGANGYTIATPISTNPSNFIVKIDAFPFVPKP